MPAGSAAGPAQPETDGELAEHARAVLERNWVGNATVPSRQLYPHQWSWDSAFTAIGYAHVDQSRAETELRSLFAGQWRTGLLPHIVFREDTAPYFPGPDVWSTDRAEAAPASPRTSGIIQPPVHASAVWRVYRHASNRDQAARFLHDMLPLLTAWHDYLYRSRTRDGGVLVEIWHPWESGMDNSPLWDPILARIEPAASSMSAQKRTDVHVSAESERPSDAEYQRYLHLVRLFRDSDYDDARIQAATPFAVHDVLFNSILVQANWDLAAIARVVGAPSGPHRERAHATAQAVEEQLWSGDGYVDVDVLTSETLRDRVWSRYSPLLAAIPDTEHAAVLLDELPNAMVSIEGVGPAMPSLSPDDARFNPTLYWRGPIWINVNWFLYHGLQRYGRHAEAAALRTTMIGLARKSGFTEHYNPMTGQGHGGTEFAWSAALVLDLLHHI